MAAVVIVETRNDNASACGSGFILYDNGKLYLVSNQHVFSDARHIVCRTVSGVPLKISDRTSIYVSPKLDLLKIPLDYVPAGVKAFEMLKSIPSINSRVSVLGNSEGAGVVRRVEGKVLGVGPELLEVDAKFVEGNSGGPVIDSELKVCGVATYAIRKRCTWVKEGTDFDNAVRRMALRLHSGTVFKKVPLKLYMEQEVLISDVYQFLDLLRILYFAPYYKDCRNELDREVRKDFESDFAKRWKEFVLVNNIQKRCRMFAHNPRRYRGFNKGLHKLVNVEFKKAYKSLADIDRSGKWVSEYQRKQAEDMAYLCRQCHKIINGID